jgi:hypothetical protein
MIERILRKLPLERLPRRDRAFALQAIEAEFERERTERDERSAALERVAEEYRRAAHDLMGEKRSRELSAASRQERAALGTLRRMPGAAPRVLERAARDGRKRLARVARELGVDLSRLRDLGAARGRRVERLIDPPAAAVSVGWLKEGNFGTGGGPGGVHPHLAPPDATVTPPFLIGLVYHHSDRSEGFSVGYDWEIDEISGKVTARTELRCPDADWQNDYASVWVDAVQVFQYTSPRSGRLSVIVEAINLEGRSQVALDDEFGFSDSRTHLRNYMTLRVYHPATPAVSFAEMSHLERTGTSGTVAETHYYPGSTYLASLVSNGSIQAGDTFFVAVGTRNSDTSTTDDVEVRTTSDFSWVIRSLELRILDGEPVIPVVGREAVGARRAKRRTATRRKG